MKKWAAMILLLTVALTGCSSQETFETMDDEYVQPASVTVQQVHIKLPQSAMVPALQSEDAGTLYLCDGYTVTVQTVDSGDLNRTLQDATGFTKDSLTILQTRSGSLDRYDCVWTAAGEGEDQVGRLALIDDGSYHYVLTTMAGASQIQRIEGDWQLLFDSFTVGGELPVSTGS